MTDEVKLRQKIDDSGFKMRFIAKKIGITYQTLLNKVVNRTEFNASEIQGLCDLLGICDEERMEIFFRTV